METIIRVVKDHDADPFARIDKVPINDPDKSWKALGILTYVLSKPDGWEVNVVDLVNHATDGEKAVRSGLAELIKLKYCSRAKILDKKTKRVLKWVYIFYERPYPGKLLSDQVIYIDPLPQNGKVDRDPLSGFPQVEKGPPINNDVNNKIDSLKKKGINSSNSINIKEPGKIIAAADISKKDKNQFQKIKRQIINMGWGGSWDDIIKNYVRDPEFVRAWVQHIQSKSGLRNPAGLLRHGLRSGEYPKTQETIERKKYLEGEFAEFIEQ